MSREGRNVHPFGLCTFPFVKSSFCPEFCSPILVKLVVPLARLEKTLCVSQLSHGPIGQSHNLCASAPSFGGGELNTQKTRSVSDLLLWVVAMMIERKHHPKL